MNIDDIRHYILRDEYEISVHAEKERYAEDISISDIETAIASGDSWKIILLIPEEKVA